MLTPVPRKTAYFGDIMYIKVYNNDERSEACLDVLRASRLPSTVKGLCLLPIPSTSDGVHIRGCSDERLSDIIPKSGVVYCGYAIPTDIARMLQDGGGIVSDASLDEDFLLDNAYLTSLASLGYILHTYSIDLSRPIVGVVGYGRIGSSLTRMLLSLGIPIRVYTSREDLRLELGSLGVSSSGYFSDASFDGVDLIVNTAPSITLSPPADIPILELASGDNFPENTVTRLPALPAKHYPRSAGRIWANAILRAIFREVEE